MEFYLNLTKEEESKKLGNVLKLVFIIIILAAGLFAGFLPLFCKISKKSTRFLGFFNSFSGGIFIGIGLFLLLPESKSVSEKWAKENILNEKLQGIPYCFFVSFFAYSFLLFVEKVVFNSTSLIPMISGEEAHGHGHTHEEEYMSDAHRESVQEKQEEDEDEDEEAFKNVVSSKGKFASFLGMRNLGISRAENKQGEMDRSLFRSSQILTRTFTKPNEYNPDLDLLVNPIKSDFIKNNLKSDHSHDHSNEHIEANSDTNNEIKTLSSATPYLLLAALCLDGFFEGIALGIQSNWFNVLFVAIAIVINKISVAFSLGISFKKSNTDIKTFIRFILLFSLFCPFGIILGYFTVSNQLLKGILLAFASGTFIYVSCSVVIVEEFAITKHRFSKYFCFLFGGLATAGISLLSQIDN